MAVAQCITGLLVVLAATTNAHVFLGSKPMKPPQSHHDHNNGKNVVHQNATGHVFVPLLSGDGSQLCALDTAWKTWHGRPDQCQKACQTLEGCYYFNYKVGDICEMFDCTPLIHDVISGCRAYQREDTVASCTPDATGAVSSRCCSFPFTWQGKTYLQCTEKSANSKTLGCLRGGKWVTCQSPANYKAVWESSKFGSEQLPLFDINNWILIANRVASSKLSFNQAWAEYRDGFGQLSLIENYWIGNKYLNELTDRKHGQVKLRVEIQRTDERWYYAEYRTFSVGNEESGFQLTISATGYHGDAGEALGGSNGLKFCTKDSDNADKCAARGEAGWWYTDKCGAAAAIQGSWSADSDDINDVIASRIFIKQANAFV